MPMLRPSHEALHDGAGPGGPRHMAVTWSSAQVGRRPCPSRWLGTRPTLQGRGHAGTDRRQGLRFPPSAATRKGGTHEDRRRPAPSPGEGKGRRRGLWGSGPQPSGCPARGWGAPASTPQPGQWAGPLLPRPVHSSQPALPLGCSLWGGRALPPELQVATPATEDGTVVALPRSRTAAALGPEASAGSLGAGRPGSCRGRSGFRRRSLQAPPPRASLRSPCPQQLQGGPQVPSLGMRGFSGRDSPLHRSTCGCMPVLVFTPACTHMCVCVCVNTCVSPGTQAWRAQG